jgi:hypothetical protein
MTRLGLDSSEASAHVTNNLSIHSLDSRFHFLDSRFLSLWIPDSALWIPDSSLWIPDSALWIPDSSLWIPDSAPWIPDSTTLIPDSRSVVDSGFPKLAQDKDSGFPDVWIPLSGFLGYLYRWGEKLLTRLDQIVK